MRVGLRRLSVVGEVWRSRSWSSVGWEMVLFPFCFFFCFFYYVLVESVYFFLIVVG